MKNYVINSINGIWNSYGCIPEPGDSITLSVEESGIEASGSLKKLCGFPDDEYDIGQIASSKEVSELVVMLPMIEKIDSIELSEDIQVEQEEMTQDLCVECVDNFCEHVDYIINNSNNNKNSPYFFSITENADLFKIKESTINKILNVENYKLLSIYEIKKILNERILSLNLNNNIVKSMISMVNYYIPPHLNWLLNKDLPPIVMYTAEFKSTFYREDLSDIWQGTMPKQATNPEEEIIDIEHFLLDEEMFSGYNLSEVDNIKMSIFKCKKIALSDYDAIVKGSVVQENLNWYNYNWPYDNFSLVELLQVQSGEVHDFTNDGSLEDGVLIDEVTRTTTVNGETYTKTVK